MRDVAWRVGMGGLLALPVAAAVADAQVALAVKIAVALLAVLTALAPAAGLVAFTLTLPLSLLFEIKVGARPPAALVAECLAFAFAAGAWCRTPPAEARRGERLAGPALVIAAAVLATLVVQLVNMQVIAPMRPVAREVWVHVTREYWHDTSTLPPIHLAWIWLACLATAVAAERIVRARSDLSVLFVKTWLVTGGLSACYAGSRLLELLRKGSGSPADKVVWLLSNVRISALHPDPNAAGSLFVLFLVPAVLLGLVWRRRAVPVVVLPFVLLAFALAQSRAAIVGAVVAWALVWIVRVRRIRAIALGLGATIAAIVVAGVLTAPTHASASRALNLRVQMTEVGWRIVSKYPIFGVGLGEYPRMSRRFTTAAEPEFAAFAPSGENAHNNFLQVLGELGLPALGAFLWLTLPIAGAFRPQRPAEPLEARAAMAAGIAAFLITAVSGHPLLIQQVSVSFFLALGMTAGLALPAERPVWTSRLFVAGAAFYALSLLWRLP